MGHCIEIRASSSIFVRNFLQWLCEKPISKALRGLPDVPSFIRLVPMNMMVWTLIATYVQNQPR